MARLKPNKSLKSPNKQHIEEQNKQNKTNNTPRVTPHTTKTSKRTTGTEKSDKRTEKRDTTQRKYKQKPENIQYYESESIHRWINRNDRNKEQFDEAGDVGNSSDDDFLQPSDEDAQGNALTEEEQALIKMNDSHQTPNKEDAKPVAQPENEDSSPSPEPDRRRLHKKEQESDHTKILFATLAENTQTQLREQGEKHAMEIATMKWANLDTYIF
jgi:hypothetical protein